MAIKSPKFKTAHVQEDLWGCETAVITAQPVTPIVRTEEERKKLSEARFVNEFSATALYAEIGWGNDDEHANDERLDEGKKNPKYDYRLKTAVKRFGHCSDKDLQNFVEELHRQCLEQNLAFLESEDEKPWVLKEKGYILQWVFCVDMVRGVPQSKIHFSFQNCCLTEGVRPDDLRSALLQKPRVRDLLVRLKLVEQRGLPPLRRKVFYADIVGQERAAEQPSNVAIAGI